LCGNLILTESRAIGSFYFIFLIYTIIWTLSGFVFKSLFFVKKNTKTRDLDALEVIIFVK